MTLLVISFTIILLFVLHCIEHGIKVTVEVFQSTVDVFQVFEALSIQPARQFSFQDSVRN